MEEVVHSPCLIERRGEQDHRGRRPPLHFLPEQVHQLAALRLLLRRQHLLHVLLEVNPGSTGGQPQDHREEEQYNYHRASPRTEYMGYGPCGKTPAHGLLLPDLVQNNNQGGEDHVDRGQADGHTQAGDESELGEPPKIENDQRKKSHGRGNGRGEHRPAQVFQAVDQRVFDALAVAALLDIAIRRVDRKVYSQPEHDGEDEGRYQIEIAHGQPRNAHGPGEP